VLPHNLLFDTRTFNSWLHRRGRGRYAAALRFVLQLGEFILSGGSILFVHGTGVRLPGFERTFEKAVEVAAACGVERTFFPCAWGDPLGVEFKGLSMPDVPSEDQLAKQEEDFAQWSWLLEDPLFELGTLTIKDSSADQSLPDPSGPSPWEAKWTEVQAYKPSQPLCALLQRGGLEDLWEPAWNAVLHASVTLPAFEASAHELPEVYRALARALVAQLHVEATSRNRPGPSATLRSKLLSRLIEDWGQAVLGLTNFFYKLVERAGTRFVRQRRNAFNQAVALPLGDVLLYQTFGEKIRSYISEAMAECPPPVTILAHSLGGIACVDLLAKNHLAKVDGLVTLGSQSPFMHEIGALSSLKSNERLRPDFPPWLNIFDRNDFLSFVARRIFPCTIDFEVASGQPFPESHSAYFGNEEVWTRIRNFINEPRA
jgi:hypothetical protein